MLWNASDNLVWIHNCFHFFKTGIFRAGSVKGQTMRIPSLRQFRRLAAERFDRSRQYLRDTIGSVFVLCMRSNILIDYIVVCSKYYLR